MAGLSINTQGDQHDDPAHELLIKVAGGDEMAFRLLFDQYWDNIYSVALVFTRSDVLSEEIVQDVFVKVWNKREQLPGLKSFRNWLFIVARNHIYSEINKKINDPKYVVELQDYFAVAEGSTADRLLYKESEKLIAEAVEELSPQQKMVFRLSREEGLSHEQISQKLGLSKNTVKVHMTKALQAVRQYLQSHSSGIVFIYAIFRVFFS